MPPPSTAPVRDEADRPASGGGAGPVPTGAGPVVTTPARWRAPWTAPTLAAALGALSLVLHVPGLVVRLVNSDEASLASMAMVLQDGGTLYHRIADRKPPVVPYVYAAVFRLTGTGDVRYVRLLAIVVLAATALVLALEARRRYGRGPAALACGALFLLGGAAFFPADAQAAGFEMFMLLPMTAAVVLAGRGRPVWAGVCLAVACLCKQTAATTVVPVAYLCLQAGGWRAVRRMVAATVAPVVGVAFLFGAREFLLWTVTGNGGYLALQGSWGDAVRRAAGMTVGLAALEVSLVALCLVAARRRVAGLDLWLWLASGLVAVAAGLRFFGHYYLQLLPPLALIAAPALVGLARRTRQLAVSAAVAPAVVCTAVGFFPIGDSGELHYRTVAAHVRLYTDEDDTLFVWGDVPELYWASGRDPATRFVHNGFLTGSSGGRPSSGRGADLPGAWAMLTADVLARPPDLIVDTTGGHMRQSELHPLDQTALWPHVVRDYRLVDTTFGVRLYLRVPPTS